MSELKMTPARLALLRAIKAGEIKVDRDGTQALGVWRNGQLVSGRRLANIFHALANAGLVQKVPFLAPGTRPAKLTPAGESVLAQHDDATKQA